MPLSNVCSDHHVEVVYISAHTNYQLGAAELPHLPLPISTSDEVALKVSKSISTKKILEGHFYFFLFFFFFVTYYAKLDVRENVGNRVN